MSPVDDDVAKPDVTERERDPSIVVPQPLAGTAKILGLVVIVTAAISLLVLYVIALDWAIERYGSEGPTETTWEDYGAVLYLWIPPALLGAIVAGYLWWVLDQWRTSAPGANRGGIGS